MMHMRYEERSADGRLTGRIAEVQADAFAPMTWDALVNRVLSAPSDVNLRVTRGTVVESTIDGVSKASKVDINAIVETRMTTLHLALVPGGWLPAGLALDACGVMFPDRCTLSELKGRYKPGRSAERAADFINLFDNQGTRINPLLLALEGNTRSFPSRDEIKAQVAEASSKFRELLPASQVHGDEELLVNAIAGLSDDLRDTAQNTIDFLMDVALLLRHDVRRDRLQSVLIQIAEAARRRGVLLLSLPVLTAFSAASLTGRMNPGRKALKFTVQPYTRNDAYNAMSDLRSLQVYGIALAMFPSDRPTLVTGDKDLALVWVGSHLTNFRLVGNQFAYEVDPLPEFLPPHAAQIWRRVAGHAPEFRPS